MTGGGPRSATMLLGLLLATAVEPANAVDCSAITDADARRCCEANLPQSDMRQQIRLTVADDRGTISNLAATLWWKRFDDGRTRARVDVSAPPRDAGTKVLLTERERDAGEARPEPEVVVYTPQQGRDRLMRISALSGDMFGTDFSYEEFAHFYGTDADINVVRLADEAIAGETVIVLESRPSDLEAAYDRGAVYSRVVSRFEAARCIALSTRFYEDDDTLVKELVSTPDSVRDVAGRWVPFELTMHDLDQDTRTILQLDEIEFDPGLRDSLFSRSSLKRRR